jgi:hypothetical protein
MTALGIWAAVEKFGGVGIIVFIFLIWYFDRRDRIKEHKDAMSALHDYRETLEKGLKDHQRTADDNVKEIRQMYVNNVSLVKRSLEINERMNEALTVNIQTQTRVAEMVATNQYCPIVRDKAGRA